VFKSFKLLTVFLKRSRELEREPLHPRRRLCSHPEPGGSGEGGSRRDACGGQGAADGPGLFAAAMRNASEGEARKPHGGFSGGAGADRSIKLELDIQKDRMGKLIGTNGQTIKNIQEKVSTVRLNTPGKDDAASDEYKFVAVTLKGKASDVFKASKMVHDVATACLAVLTFRIGAASCPCPSRPAAAMPRRARAVRCGRCEFRIVRALLRC
jgi:hypothetical protein